MEALTRSALAHAAIARTTGLPVRAAYPESP